MEKQIAELQQTALAAIAGSAQLSALQELRVQYLGKKGALTALLRGMGSLSPEERPRVGQLVNDVRQRLETALAEKEAVLSEQALAQKLASEKIDISLPGRRQVLGHRHPITLTMDRIKSTFVRMGFQIAEGPEIENDYYNFEALNLPKDHPARDMQDSFYFSEEYLLRTQTSPMQARMTSC